MQPARPRLLFIDDDQALIRLVQRDFERHGFEVEGALDGNAGLARLRAATFDAAALDHNMPGQNGLEVLDAIKRLPDAPPVIYVTGEAEGRIAVAALRGGAADYVAKEAQGEFLPLLRAAISSAIERRQMQRAREQAECELRKSRDRFEALAAERELLIQEANHRVANSLQLVSSFLRLQAGGAASEETRAALASAIARIDAIGHVHRQLYNAHDIRAVDPAPYLSSLIAELTRTGADRSGVRVTVEVESIETSTDRALTIGIVATELAINALKHAFAQEAAGSLLVTCRQQGGELVLAVEDDGAGMAEPGAIAGGGQSIARAGLGQRIIKMMAMKLQARTAHEPVARGTRIVLRIPAEAQTPAGA